LWTLNTLDVFLSILLTSMQEVIHEEAPQNVPALLLTERDRFVGSPMIFLQSPLEKSDRKYQRRLS